MTAGPLDALREFARPEPVVDACHFCAEVLPDQHRHVARLDDRALLCACRACHLLFQTDGAAGGRYRAVSDRHGPAPAEVIAGIDERASNIPVGVAFFVRSSAVDGLVAFYPGPMGATESQLPVGDWRELESTLATDVEALLVRRAGDGWTGWVVPVDACYELVGLMRRHWEGFAGGPAVDATVEEFFARVAFDKETVSVFVRALKSVILVLLGWLAITSIPGVARYLRLREM